MNYTTAIQYLNTFINYEHSLHKLENRKFNLDRVKLLLDRLNSPQEVYKIIHVAGSKGKGSVCIMTANILKHAGYRVGLYTSPHLIDVRERVCINGEMISEEDFASVIKEIKPVLEEVRKQKDIGSLTYFEVLTAAALYYFQKRAVDIAVLETGLGGRLDATNAVDSNVAVITSIGYEHTHILGETLTKIAGEKAAIIKTKGQKVICARQEEETVDVINKRCKEYAITPEFVDGNFDDIPVPGEHQKHNAQVAVATFKALKSLGYNVSNEAIAQGLSTVKLPGRFEVINTNPAIILDCAHTKESMRTVVDTLQESFPGKEATLIFGASDDKNIKAMADLLVPVVTRVILTRANHPRAKQFTVEEGETLFPAKEVEITGSVEEAIGLAERIIGNQGVVLITGSVFFIGEIKRFKRGLNKLKGIRYQESEQIT